MSDPSFTTTFSVHQTPQEAFDAINDVRGWWSGDIDGRTEKLNDVFTYRYQDIHYSKMQLVEVRPNQRIVWLVLESDLSFAKDRSEWTGTRVVFEISPNRGQTEVRFTHEGLTPHDECFEACSSAWGGYINGSLRNRIATGDRRPSLKETVRG